MQKIKINKSWYSSQRQIAAGGEGTIYDHPANPGKVLKIYHSPRPAKFADHLEKLSALPKEFVVPDSIFLDSAGSCLGFSMKYVNFNDYWLFNNFFNKGFCSSNQIDGAFKSKVLRELYDAIQKLHDLKIVIGDLNQYNLFVSKAGEILFVDVDSYGTADNAHSGVLLEDIRDWTTTNINEATDAWAYDILAFWATTYCHPFKWVAPGNKESLEMRVRTNKSILSKIPGVKIPALYQPPTGTNLIQFQEVFAGRRYMVSVDGAHTPVNVVIKQPAASRDLKIRKLYEDVTQVHACSTHLAIHQGNEWIFEEAKIPGSTRTIERYVCDELFPSSAGGARVRGNVLHGVSDAHVFGQPVFYYENGALCVVDYGTDTQWNFDLNQQMAGISKTMTPVFSKSIVKRDSLIQNFGQVKMLNIPRGNSYYLSPLPPGTKNAIHVDVYTSAEWKDRSKTKYSIFSPDQNGSIDLDYLPYFTVKNKLVFVPEEGKIDLYREMVKTAEFECDICTRDSRLYSTDAGIVLLESNNLYLLNTKS